MIFNGKNQHQFFSISGLKKTCQELLACATCFSTIIYRDDILQAMASATAKPPRKIQLQLLENPMN